MNTEKYKNLIFDFGGVIIDIDFNRTIEAFVALGAGEFNTIYSKATQSGIFDAFDKGELTQAAFVAALKDMLPEDVTEKLIIDAWNTIIIGIPKTHIRLLESLRSNYDLYLLSNTNVTHYNLYTPELQHNFGYESLHELFKEVFLSFELGMRKPDREIFDYVFNKTKIRKEETLFIDDSKHIIDAARSYGIPSLWLKEGMDVCELFDGNGKLIEAMNNEE